jgi:NtrC-family two-component system response regulator AlgB
MPPLRARPDDLLRFASYYAEHFASQIGHKIKGLTDEARERILAHTWPGNLRELRNAIERAVILSSGELLHASDLPPDVHPAAGSAAAAVGDGAPVQTDGGESLLATPGLTLQQLEEAYINRVLGKSGSLAEAATLLGIDQATLYRKRKKMNLD